MVHYLLMKKCRSWLVAWVVYSPSLFLALFVCIFGIQTASLRPIFGPRSIHPLQIGSTDSGILIQTLATRTKEHIFCCWVRTFRSLSFYLESKLSRYTLLGANGALLLRVTLRLYFQAR